MCIRDRYLMARSLNGLFGICASLALSVYFLLFILFFVPVFYICVSVCVIVISAFLPINVFISSIVILCSAKETCNILDDQEKVLLSNCKHLSEKNDSTEYVECIHHDVSIMSEKFHLSYTLWSGCLKYILIWKCWSEWLRINCFFINYIHLLCVHFILV